MKVFLNSFENSSSSITKNQVATILNKTIEEAGFKHCLLYTSDAADE